MALNQKFERQRVNSIPTSGLVAGTRYDLNVGGGKYKTVIISDTLEAIIEAGAEFIEKDTMSDFRSITSKEIESIQKGYYKGVRLNGYYIKGDTPHSVEYYISNTSDSDDGGSIISIGSIKFESVFVSANALYWGAKGDRVADDTIPLNNFAKYILNSGKAKTAECKGKFKITDQVRFVNTGASLRTDIVSTINFDAEFVSDYTSTEPMILVENWPYTQITGKLKVTGKGGTTYSTRTNDKGIHFLNCTRISVQNIEVSFMRLDGITLTGTTSLYKFDFVRTNYCGSTNGTAPAVRLNLVSWSNTGTTNSTSQRSVITVDNIPNGLRADYTDFLIIDNKEYFISAIDSVNKTITVFPWLQPVTSAGEIRAITGSGIRVEGGDVSCGLINRLDSFACGVGLLNRSLYPCSLNSHVMQSCGAGHVLGSSVTSASVGGSSLYSYFESNFLDIVKVTTTAIGYRFNSTSALNLSKVSFPVAIGNASTGIPSAASAFRGINGIFINERENTHIRSKDRFIDSSTGITEINTLNAASSFYHINANSQVFNLVDNADATRLFELNSFIIHISGLGSKNNPTGNFVFNAPTGYTVNNQSTITVGGFNSPVIVMGKLVNKNWIVSFVKENVASVSPDIATQAAGANPTKAEFDALLAELRDLKNKMRIATSLAT